MLFKENEEEIIIGNHLVVLLIKFRFVKLGVLILIQDFFRP